MSDSDSLPVPTTMFPADDAVVIRLVTAETERARAQHNFSIERSGVERCLRILVEEVGEAAGAIEELDLAENAVPIDVEKLYAAEQHLLDEIVQVASSAMRWASARLRAMAETRAGDTAGDAYVLPKKFFTFSDGYVTYWMVAASAEHAVSLLDGHEFGDPSKPFSEAKDEDGDPLALTEITEEKAATVYVFDEDDRDRLRAPLTERNIGAMYSTET